MLTELNYAIGQLVKARLYNNYPVVDDCLQRAEDAMLRARFAARRLLSALADGDEVTEMANDAADE